MAKNINSRNLRPSGLEIIGEIPWGTHFCQFYKTKRDLLDILIPYFIAGLKNNEYCVWITTEHLLDEEAKTALKKALPDFQKYLKNRQIEIIPYTKWYLKGGRFNKKRVLSGWVDKLNKGLKRGFSGLRLTGNTFWLESTDWKKFTNYEEEVNKVINQYRMIALCTYSLDKCGINEILGVVANHQSAIIKNEGKWQVIEGTERKKIEDKISYLASFPQLNTNPIIEIGKKHEILYMNPAAERLFLKQKEGYISHLLKNIKPVKRPLTREVEVNEKTWLQNIVSTPNGNVRIYHIDISKRKKAEKTLREAEEKLRMTMNNSLDAIYRFDIKNNRFDYVSPAMKKISGFSTEEYLAMSSEDVLKRIHPDDLEYARKEIKKNPASNAIEYRFKQKNGPYHWISTRYTTTKDENGRPAYRVGVARNITIEKKYEESLKKSEVQLKTAQRIAEIGSWELDIVKNKLIWSDEVFRIFEIDKDRFGASYDAFLNTIHPDDRKMVNKAYINSLKTKAPYDITHRLKFPDGRIKYIRERCETFFDRKGKPIKSVGSVQDVTEQKNIEQAKNEFISLAAHQLRTPLSIISLAAEILSRTISQDVKEDERQYLEEILNNTQRMKGLINLFLNVSRIDLGQLEINPIPSNVQDIAEELLKEMLPQIKAKNLQLKTEFEKNLPVIKIDQKILHIALENILTNAIKYTPGNGEISFKIKMGDKKDVIFKISDTGYGVPKSQQSLIFTKLFRSGNTKTNVEGIGLGLYMTRGMITQAGGKIWLESEENKGSTFYISIPLTGMKKRRIKLEQ